jgi:hypothetical protein
VSADWGAVTRGVGWIGSEGMRAVPTGRRGLAERWKEEGGEGGHQ